MEDLFGALDKEIDAAKILGYLNLSDGRADPRWQKQLSDAYAFLAENGDKQPWISLLDWLEQRLDALKASGSAAFKNDKQARKILELIPLFLENYRAYHSDILGHLPDADLFLPFFLAKVFETLLKLALEKGFPRQPESFLKNAILQFNDFVGYRPVALLETRPSGEPYPHEKFRCVPLYLRNAGTSYSPYSTLIQQALDILGDVDPSLLSEANFDFDNLDELSMDVRGYDHSHPANLRPNYFFGEWDPQYIDEQGRFRRFVVRKALLDVLKDRVDNAADKFEENSFEAAAVLAGTILMAASVSGRVAGTHEASASLAKLIPGIARVRDTFYEYLLKKASPEHQKTLLEEKGQLRQAFGGARQHLNNLLGRKRASHVQHRFLGLLLANMGYLDASRAQARKIEPASGRMLAEILGLIRLGHLEVERSLWAQAAQRPNQAFAILQRAIECGASADPWNVLGFQGLFPLSPAREDSTRDPRIEELLAVMEHIFLLTTRLMCEAAANGDEALVQTLEKEMESKAKWWDRFATYQVSGVRAVRGGDALGSARMVSRALLKWHHRGETPADLAFWREQLSALRTPRAFAMVVDLLLRQGDQIAALGLLMSWLSQADKVPLEEGNQSFHALAFRWLLATAVHREKIPAKQLEQRHFAVRKFFAQLEANAEDYWQVPVLEKQSKPEDEEKEEDVFDAAYDDVSYLDTTGNDDEGAVSDGPRYAPFELEEEASNLEDRLHFLNASSKLWQVAAYYLGSRTELNPEDKIALGQWVDSATQRLQKLGQLVDALHQSKIPDPGAEPDAIIEYDRQRNLKESLMMEAITACVETASAVNSMRGALGVATEKEAKLWENSYQDLERSLLRGNPTAAKEALKLFRKGFAKEPLVYTTLSNGGDPHLIVRVRLAQSSLDFTLVNLPRVGLISESLKLLVLAKDMEKKRHTKGRGVSEYNRHFTVGFRSVIETIIETAVDETDAKVLELLEKACVPFEKLWVEHSWTGQLSSSEGFLHQKAFDEVREFIINYGKDIFHARFMTLANLRGVIHLGAANFLTELVQNPDPLHPVKLADDLGDKITLNDASRILGGIILTLVENYQEFKDYNTSCTLSDYGNMLHVLLSFLRVKAIFERKVWLLRPRMMVHELLARMKRTKAAKRWQESLHDITKIEAAAILDLLNTTEKETGVRIISVRDRIENGFTASLAVDRLCALVEPAMGEARKKSVPRAFRTFLEELETQAANPSGVGRDIPEWLVRLEAEVQRVQMSQTAIVQLAEGLYKINKFPLDMEHVTAQIDEINLEAFKGTE